jgi:cyclopropane-fatty-acyl-phospholipid synthase
MKLLKLYSQFYIKKFINLLNTEAIPLEIVDLSGKVYKTASNSISHRLIIKDPRFFKSLHSPNALSLGEAYIKEYFDIEGDVRTLYTMLHDRILNTEQKKNKLTSFIKSFVDVRQKEKENIEYHYDAPSTFYRIFLGRTMGYTCGYYPDQTTTMSEAQERKMDIICKKLKLKKGEHLLDVGCGWGNFAIYAAEHYGVTVTGITLSEEQKIYADKLVEASQLSVSIKIMNYRDLPLNYYDKISCIGMSEHVGQKHMQEFFNTIYKTLKQGGLFLHHSITTNTKRQKGLENSFLNKYMYPGGELMFEHDLVKCAEIANFELLNAENFRPHYVTTLNDWIDRIEDRKSDILNVISEQVYRIYHTFFIGSAASFKLKEISLFQNLFYKTSVYDTDNYFNSIYN